MTSMQLRLLNLTLTFSKSVEIIPFSPVNYFYGQMGAGKSSIARLIDFCLGGTIDMSPALQSEFVSASLELNINGHDLILERQRDSTLIAASWTVNDEKYDRIIPSRKAEGVVVPGTKIEVLSDLIFHLIGIQPPLVRKSKQRSESELSRLSFRDLFWYCYLDQDGIDNKFFHLEAEADFYKRLKSKDVMRFILGYHQEKVAELESELQYLQVKRIELQAGAKALEGALIESEVGNEENMLNREAELQRQLDEVNVAIETLRNQPKEFPHGAEPIRNKSKQIASELESLEDAIPEVEKNIDTTQRHANEIIKLGLKIQRVAGARAVLGGVDYIACPRCAQKLPERDENLCIVCGQDQPTLAHGGLNSNVLKEDSKARVEELEDSINRQKSQLRSMRLRYRDLAVEKRSLDVRLNEIMREYDSAFLSNTLSLEKQKAEITQKISNVQQLIQLPRRVKLLFEEADTIFTQEQAVRRELNEARKGAEADHQNIEKLSTYFKDCLLRAQVPGISDEDIVSINSKDFVPEIYSPRNESIVTSFSNLWSGGKKTLFKACFALAIHRLAVESGAMLPSILIIDSSMKNISERENKEQFESFYNLLYELLEDELSETQVIVIDKEYFPPSEGSTLDIYTRHMMPNSDEFPPLISYYRGN